VIMGSKRKVSTCSWVGPMVVTTSGGQQKLEQDSLTAHRAHSNI
jgi:hypothetical protein